MDKPNINKGAAVVKPEPAKLDPQKILPLHEIEALAAQAHEDPQITELRQKLAAREKELDEAKLALAAVVTPLKPLPDDGPGEYHVILRHSPSRLKELKVQAKNPKDAWDQFVNAARVKNDNPKDPDRKDLKAFEAYLGRGRLDGYERTVRKLNQEVAA